MAATSSAATRCTSRAAPIATLNYRMYNFGGLQIKIRCAQGFAAVLGCGCEIVASAADCGRFSICYSPAT